MIDMNYLYVNNIIIAYKKHNMQVRVTRTFVNKIFK